MKTKTKSNSILHGLVPDKKAQVDEWLFAQNLSFEEVVKLCRTEWNVTIGPSSVRRYYCSRKPEYLIERAIGAGEKAGASPVATAADAEAKYRAVLTRLGEFVLERAGDLHDEESRKSVAEFTRVLIAARREANYAQRSALAREKFEFDAATACLLNQIELQAIVKDEALDDGQRIQKIREELFGPNLPK